MTIDERTESVEPTEDETPSTSRRTLLSKGAIAAAVGAAAGIAVSKAAGAANGDTMYVGVAHSGTLTTKVTTDGDGQAGLHGEHDGTTTSGPGVKGVSLLGYGVHGENTNSGGGTGVYGVSNSTSGGAGVRGVSVGTSSYGVHGTNNYGNVGVYGHNIGATGGIGVKGESDAGTGVAGAGAAYDFIAMKSGVLRVQSAKAGGIAPTTAGAVGSIARGTDGTLWYCYATNKWQKVSGPGTAGAYHPVTPFRVYDSRLAVTGGLAGSTWNTISVKDARDPSTYAVTLANATPAGAVAVAANVTAIRTVGSGFATVNPGGDETVGASHLNWTMDGLNIANAGIFSISASRELSVFIGGITNINLAIDITGYFM